MTRTGAWTVVILAVVGAAIGLLVEIGLTANGRATVVPPYSYAVTIVAIAVLLIGFAVPVWRSTRGARTASGLARHKVDPFYATRTVALAKAASITSAVLAGATLSLLGYLLTRPVTASGTLGQAIASAASSVVLLVAGLVAEAMCRIPPDDDRPDGSHESIHVSEH